MARSGGGVANHGYFKAVFEEVPEVRFDAHVRQHPAEDDLGDCPLAELQDEVVAMWTPDLVRAGNDCVSVVDVRFEFVEPIGAGPRESLQREWARAGKRAGAELI